MNGEALEEAALSLLTNHPPITSISTADGLPAWLYSNPLQPRLLLIGSKSSPPQLLKALAIEFDQYVETGFVDPIHAPLLQQFNITAEQAPVFIVIQPRLLDIDPNHPGQQRLEMPLHFLPKPYSFVSLARLLDFATTKYPRSSLPPEGGSPPGRTEFDNLKDDL